MKINFSHVHRRKFFFGLEVPLCLTHCPFQKDIEGKDSWVVTGRFLSKSLGRKYEIFKRIDGLITFGFYWGKNLFPNINWKLEKSKRKKENSETLTVENNHRGL